jgi:hypothetical protein
VKRALRTIVPQFTAARVLREYDERMQAMPRGGPSAARWRRERCDTMRRVP